MFRIDYPFKKEILACGAPRQASFCLTKKNCAYVVSDLGNLDDSGAFTNYKQQIENAKQELKIKPKIVSYDLQLESDFVKYARALEQDSKNIEYLPIQHHKAHAASCIAENGIEGDVIAVVFDNDALGEDGTTWGAEFFTGGLQDLKRAAHFQQGLSMAQLFDSVAVFLKLRDKLEYPGQGVAELERIINRSSHIAGRTYEFKLKQENNHTVICPELIFENISQDLKINTSKSIISTAFHNTVIEMARQLIHKIGQKEKIKNIVLTGSVFLNKFLSKQLIQLLTEDGLSVFSHKYFSSNDSSISFGRAVLANEK